MFQACAPRTPVAPFARTSDGQAPEAEPRNQAVEAKEEFSEVDVVSGQGISLSVDETIDVSSESESASSSEAETDLMSSEDDRKIEEPPSKIPRILRVAESPEINEVWMQNPSSKNRSCSR